MSPGKQVIIEKSERIKLFPNSLTTSWNQVLECL